MLLQRLTRTYVQTGQNNVAQFCIISFSYELSLVFMLSPLQGKIIAWRSLNYVQDFFKESLNRTNVADRGKVDQPDQVESTHNMQV